jgi:hypothetical protein
MTSGVLGSKPLVMRRSRRQGIEDGFFHKGQDVQWEVTSEFGRGIALYILF